MTHEHDAESAPGQAGGPPPGEMSEEQLRARLEEELRRITVSDVLLQTLVSLVNLAGQRLGLAPGSEDMRDLEQARLAIEAVRALLPVVEEKDAEHVRPVRDALSQLQVAYAQIAGGQGGEGEAGAAEGPQPEEPPKGPESPRRGGLWVPPGSNT